MNVVMMLIAFGIVLFVFGIGIFILNSNKTKQKICPGCKNNIHPNTNSCPYCGYILR